MVSAQTACSHLHVADGHGYGNLDRTLRRAVVQDVIGALLGEPVRFYEIQVQEEENVEQQWLNEIEAGLGKDDMAGGLDDAQAERRARKDEECGLGSYFRSLSGSFGMKYRMLVFTEKPSTVARARA
jgi:hypothetical protein